MSAVAVPEQARCAPALNADGFRHDLLAGLSRPQRSLPCKYLYDAEGARLFEAICKLPEYYPTRTETAILRQNAAEIAALAGPRTILVDLGSGNGQKIRLLLEHLDQPARYCPVDVSHQQLLECSRALGREFPGLDCPWRVYRDGAFLQIHRSPIPAAGSEGRLRGGPSLDR